MDLDPSVVQQALVDTLQAQDLGIERVLVPRASPAFSALGALAAAPSIDEERSYLSPARVADVGRLRELWLALDERAERYLLAAGDTGTECKVFHTPPTRHRGVAR